MTKLPDTFQSESELDAFLSLPYPETVAMMQRLPGDLAILGAGGKVGPTLAAMALQACREAQVKKRIYAIDRFPEPGSRERLDRLGVETIACDLLDPQAVAALPKAENVLFLAGRKFGVVGSESLTWMINAILPDRVAREFKKSRIVAFSTGCVYALRPTSGSGSKETDIPLPVGEYANSCLARERIFEYYSENHGTPVLIYRLNYAVDIRYGVLVDIARPIFEGRPLSRSVGALNCIWQGDAVNRALLCLEQAASPAAVLNITGEETLTLEAVAQEFSQRFGKPVEFTGADSGKAYLSDASRSIELFGKPKVSASTLIGWVADWMKAGGRSLDKPTHFQVTDGQFLD